MRTARRYLIRFAFLLRVLIPIFCRKAQIYVLYRIANKRYEQVRSLAAHVYMHFEAKTPLLSGVHSALFKNMGHAVQEDGSRGPICWAAPIAITVFLMDLPFFALGVEFRGGTLCIRQLQGVKGVPLSRNLQDWPEVLVKSCMSFAAIHRFREVRVYKANQDINFTFPVLTPAPDQSKESAVRAHQDRMRRRYDRTAEKLKFKKKKKYWVWKNPKCA